MAVLQTTINAPRSSFTLLDARGRVRADLAETNSNLFTDTDINAWLNESSDILARETGWYRPSGTDSTVIGQKEYPLPSRMVTLREVWVDSRPLISITEEQLFTFNRYWRVQGNGTPIYWYMVGATDYGLHLTPASAGVGNISLYWIGLPPKVSADQDNFYIPASHEYALLVYGKLMASVKDAHGEGQRRIPELAQEWQHAVHTLKVQVNEANMADEIAMGDFANFDARRRPGAAIPFFTSITAPV